VTNPSRIGTALSVSFGLPQAGEAELAIYSVTGQRVRTLYAGPVSAGTQRLTWDARGRDGAPVPPGLYFALLRSGATLVRQRVVLLP
jgi:flagellar hook assembly protein FlgD